MNDIRFALRMMRRSIGFTAVVLLTLTIGIGANTVMFSVVNSLLLRSLPYDNPQSLMFVETVRADSRASQPGASAWGRSIGTSPPDFYTYRERNRTFEHLDAFYNQPRNLTGGSEPERVPTLIASSSSFAALGAQPALGRSFTRREEEWGSHRVAILSDGLWQRRFGADPAILGRRVTVDGEPFVVIGVMPAAFSFLTIDAQLFVPMAFERGDNLNSHSNYFLSMVGRLKPGVTREQGSSDLNRLSDAIIAEQSINQGTAIAVTPLQDVLVRGVRRAVLVLLAAVGFVLLIACANLANLLLARASARQREIAVRLALGATRARLFRQLLVESLALSLAGGLLALGLAYLAMDALNVVSGSVLPRAEAIRIDAMVLLFTFSIAVLAGVVLGVAPAARTRTQDVHQRLKDGTQSASEAGGPAHLRASLVVVQIALSLVLLAGAGLMVKSLYELLRVDSGFQPDGVLTLQINLPPQKYVDEQLARQLSPRAYTRAVGFFTESIDRVRQLPGAHAVGAINGLPLMGEIWGKRVTLFDRPLPASMEGLSPIQYRVVAGDYFRALGIRILSGRAFSDRDTEDAPKVAIVNRALAQRDWNGADPIGKVISVNPPLQLVPPSLVEEARRSGTLPDDYEPARLTIVGVVDDVRYGALHRPAVPLVYAPYAQGSEGTTNMFLVVRASGDPLSLVGAIRRQIAQIDREQPIANVQTMQARVDASVAQQRLQMSVLAGFAIVAVLLAAVGVYGVMSYAVAQRAREIGIRFALGAARRDVLALVMRQGLMMVSIGVCVGLAGALVLTRAIRTLLFGVGSADPAVFAAMIALLSIAAGVAAYLPARRAARLDPLVTLRAE